MSITSRNARTLPPGLHADSGNLGVRGLYLKVTASGGRSWIGRTKQQGKTHKFGLGSLTDTPIPLARDRWITIRQRLWDGETPSQIRGKVDHDHSLGALAQGAHKARAGRLKDTSGKWLSLFETYMGSLWQRPLIDLTAPILMTHMKPLVASHPATARKVLGKLSIVAKHGQALGLPVVDHRDALVSALPWPRTTTQHRAAVAVADAPSVMQAIMTHDTATSAVLRLTALTGARVGTILNMRPEWIEGDTMVVP
ncbi:Arm DNA-binding domain-containing protein [Sedimentitalea sp.]|uniref:Arm DNA-binding domain-containing protein n=1 Tax=Sedimentitalea sp. TaxID=2048915 RepID=UPI003298D037